MGRGTKVVIALLAANLLATGALMFVAVTQAGARGRSDDRVAQLAASLARSDEARGTLRSQVAGLRAEATKTNARLSQLTRGLGERLESVELCVNTLTYIPRGLLDLGLVPSWATSLTNADDSCG